MFRYAKNVRLASFLLQAFQMALTCSLRLSLALSRSYWISPCISLALDGFLWLPLWLSMALTATLWHTLALSGSLLLSNLAYTALDRLSSPMPRWRTFSRSVTGCFLHLLWIFYYSPSINYLQISVLNNWYYRSRFWRHFLSKFSNMYNVHCTLYIVHSKIYIVRCTLYIVQGLLVIWPTCFPCKPIANTNFVNLLMKCKIRMQAGGTFWQLMAPIVSDYVSSLETPGSHKVYNIHKCQIQVQVGVVFCRYGWNPKVSNTEHEHPPCLDRRLKSFCV